MAHEAIDSSARRPGEPLPDAVPIYRGLRASSWRDPDSGTVRAVAFLRRQGEEQLSVSESPTNAVRHLRRHYGVAELSTGCVRRAATGSEVPLELDVVADPILTPESYDPVHAVITGLPPWAPPGSGDEQHALEAALAILESCQPRIRTVPDNLRAEPHY